MAEELAKQPEGQAMKREEADAFIAGYEKIAMTQPAWSDLIIRVPAESLQNLLRLARLGASVAAPRDDEIEAMAKAIYSHWLFGMNAYKRQWVPGGNSDKQDEARRYVRAALTALSNPEEQQ